MKLKVRNFNWLAGKPVAILNEKTAKKLNVHVEERVSLFKNKSKKFYTVIDIFSKLVNKNEIGLSHEISSMLKLKNNSMIEVAPAELSLAGKLISKKLLGKKLSKKEINIIISEIVQNNLTQAEIAYFVAAEKIKKTSFKEIIYLTEAMVENGKIMKLGNKIIADKHSIGGIAGNRTTPLVVSICSVAGLVIPKTSSRAITSAAGTADVIETISRVEFTTQQMKKIINKTGACLVWGGGLGIAPSDDKIIHVEKSLSLDIRPQLLASIMSKKIAAGSNHVLIDIPYGKGSKMSTKKQAGKLALEFKKLAEHFKIKLKIVLTNGSQPIGNGVGPVLEMLDIIAVLQNKPHAPVDLKEKSLFLSAELMKLCKIKNPKQKAREILESGKAYEKFKQIINTQNNSNDFEKRISKLKPAKLQKTIKSKKSGDIIEIDNKKINSLCRILGTPETKSAGVYLHKHLGGIKKAEPIMTLYSESKQKLDDGLRFVREFKPVVVW